MATTGWTVLLDQLSPILLSRLTPEQTAQIAVISAWDLNDVRTRVKLRMGWSEELLDEAITEYRKFITLVALDPQKSYGMVETVDEVWHQHLLNTRDYLAMCSAALGAVIHHEQQPLDTTLSIRESLREQTVGDLSVKFVGPVSRLWSSNSQVHSVAKCCGHTGPLIS